MAGKGFILDKVATQQRVSLSNMNIFIDFNRTNISKNPAMATSESFFVSD